MSKFNFCFLFRRKYFLFWKTPVLFQLELLQCQVL